MPLGADPAAALAALPTAAGVGQLVAAEKNLVLGMTSNLRRWAASHLGQGRPARAGRRPRTNLAGLATAVGWVEVDGSFRQRIAYERLLAPLVPLSARRDLKPPVFLHLDLAPRFPRVALHLGVSAGGGLYGPFANRSAAEKARSALHSHLPLRPCDASFEPHPELPLGLGCVYAQVRSCAAPCLLRVGEDDYRALAGRAASWLADPALRADAAAAVPELVTAVEDARALVIDAGREGLGLVPIRGGRVLEGSAVDARPEDLEAVLARLAWPAGDGPSDWPWLAAWLRTPKARSRYLAVRDEEPTARLAERVRAALGPRFDDKLEAARGEA